MRTSALRGVTVATLLVFTAGVAWAAVSLVERSTKSKGATTITWDSSFEDLDYTSGDWITLNVTWDVDAGVAEYSGFELKRFTPKSKKDPAEGEMGTVTQSGNSVSVPIRFTAMHYDKKRHVNIGNAHFKLFLMVDKNGDGIVDTRAGFGVNCHAEDPD